MFEVIKDFFSLIVFQPLYNALILVYDIIPDLGIAIVVLTVLIRLILMPLSRKSLESQKKMQELQPEIKKLQKKYKNDRQLQSQKMMEFYKEKKVNPASGCLPLIVQLIFLIALYRVFFLGLDTPEVSDAIYSFVSNPGQLNPISLGFFNLADPSIPLTILAAGLQYVQARMILKKNQPVKTKEVKSKKDKPEEPDFSTMMQQQMVYLGPIMTLIIGIQFPSGLIIYWIVTTIIMIIQQYLIYNKGTKEKAKKQA